MRSVTLKSAMTPSFMGRIATILPGVRPSISLASLPTASTSFVILLMATMEGSLTTIPRPFAYTSVLAVPRSMARSLENRLNNGRKFISCCHTPIFRKVLIRLTIIRQKTKETSNSFLLPSMFHFEVPGRPVHAGTNETTPFKAEMGVGPRHRDDDRVPRLCIYPVIFRIWLGHRYIGCRGCSLRGRHRQGVPGRLSQQHSAHGISSVLRNVARIRIRQAGARFPDFPTCDFGGGQTPRHAGVGCGSSRQGAFKYCFRRRRRIHRQSTIQGSAGTE